MAGGLLTRVVSSIANWNDGSDRRIPGPGAGRDDQSVLLFSCPACSKTYVAARMETCSDCGAAVHRVPTGRDLGFR